MMVDSASGVSNTRSAPNLFCRPSVMRKTPPRVPTSSPNTRTCSSRSHAVGHGLDQVRTIPPARPLRGGTDGGKDAEDIIAVDANAREAVPWGPLGDGSRRLFGQRHRDRPMVVLAEEDDRCSEDAGKVHRLMPIALRRCAVAKGAQDDVVAAAQP